MRYDIFDQVVKLRRFAEENHVVVKYEALKVHIRTARERAREKYHFFRPFRIERPLRDYLREMQENLEERIRHK